MLRVRLMGGLGNQMFQYAFARAFQQAHQVEVALDLTFLNDKTPRPNFTVRDYELMIFPIGLNCVSGNPSQLRSLPYRVMMKFLPRLMPSKFIFEQGPDYQADLFARKNAKLALGYFQTDKYFSSIRSQLIEDFTFKTGLSAKNIELSQKIDSLESVSVHVRRGDYLVHAANQNVITCCDLNYYKDSIELISKRVSNPNYFVFSDDIEWARQNLRFNGPVQFIDHNTGKDSYQDMYLMSRCKHNIIANSSFSWWGAWLNKNENKTVIAPKHWYNNPKLNSKDLYCSGWVTV